MKIKAWEIALIIITASVIICGTGASAEQQELSEKLIRLHITANSNLQDDQSLKLLVRDAVLSEAETLLRDCISVNEASAVLSENTEKIKNAAEGVISDNGYGYPVCVTLQREDFGTRYYDTFSLPAGEYLSLRVKIGSGAGKNWWCVCFPPLCTGSAVSFESAGLTDRQVMLITGDTSDVKVKFFALELISRARSLF